MAQKDEGELTVATLADVAARSGYSVMTTSRVLSGKGYASPKTREAVLAAARELGYVPNDVARSLRNSRTSSVALIISDIENSFYATIARSAEEALRPAGYRLFVASSDEDADRELEALRGAREMRAAGVLITPTPRNHQALQALSNDGVPLVQLDRIVEGLEAPAVVLDNAGAAQTAVEYLADHGHRRIAVVTGPHETTTGIERAQGALRAAEQLKFARDMTLVEAPSYLHEGSVDAVREALAWNPTAILAGNNIVLEACLAVFTESHVRVPDDVSLISFDDVPWMRWVTSPITAVRQPVQAMTEAAVHTLLGAFNETHTGPSSPVRFRADLVERESVARV
ncbi:LacI family DNA-binding transcriptional regulator [Streptomyces chartreusis]|uniref:LacI family DNA-binding transcriptional regulator n=1 Tax=Streptomyces chartreusis TaxID=1969 RepID=UPI00371725FE